MSGIELLSTTFSFPVFVASARRQKKCVHFINKCESRNELYEFLKDKSEIKHDFHLTMEDTIKSVKRYIIR